MTRLRVYSAKKLLAIGLFSILLGIASAASLNIVVNQTSQPSVGASKLLGVSTDQKEYYPNDKVYIYLINQANQIMTFRDSAYGLFFEKRVNEQWIFLLSLGNLSRTSTLNPAGDSEGDWKHYKDLIIYQLGEEFSVGKYRAGSIGFIDGIVATGGYSEFDVVPRPPPPPRFASLKLTLDKALYHSDDFINVTITNEGNETVIFSNTAYGVGFDRWDGTCWGWYDAVPGGDALSYLKPRETVQVAWKLGGSTDRPFPLGKYRAVSGGWYYAASGRYVIVWGYVEFTVG